MSWVTSILNKIERCRKIYTNASKELSLILFTLALGNKSKFIDKKNCQSIQKQRHVRKKEKENKKGYCKAFYVACKRSNLNVFIIYGKRQQTAENFFHGLLQDICGTPSKFFVSISESLLRYLKLANILRYVNVHAKHHTQVK